MGIVRALCHESECREKAAAKLRETSTTDPSTSVAKSVQSKRDKPIAIKTTLPTTTTNRQSTDNSLELTNIDILNALGPDNDGLPATCSESDLDRILHRCIVIWREFCRCAWCQTTCQASDWPPSEAEQWATGQQKIGWEDMKTSWSWAGKCAYNSTYLWRKWCSLEVASISSPLILLLKVGFQIQCIFFRAGTTTGI